MTVDGLGNIGKGKYKTVAKSGGSGIIKEQSKRSITRITNSSIKRVPMVEIQGYTEEQSELGRFKQRLRNDSSISKEYYSTIKERFSHGSDIGKKAFDKYITEDSVIDGDYIDTPHYDPKTQKISMNYSADMQNPRGNGVTWFHEHGHMVDDLAGRLSNDESFEAILRKDYLDYMKNYGKKNGLNTFDKVQTSISLDLASMRKHSAVSDILGALSEGNIRGIAGHSSAYWEDKSNITAEAFAHMFECQFDNVRYEEMKKYFPNALSMFEKILKEVI